MAASDAPRLWYCADTDRLFIWKKIRVPATLLMLVLPFLCFRFLPPFKAFEALTGITILVALTALAAARTCVAGGTKTLIAQGFFGLFTYQQPI